MKILKNKTGSNVVIPDLGITLPANGSYVIPVSEYNLFAQSVNCLSLIVSNTLCLNDGVEDLSPLYSSMLLFSGGVRQISAIDSAMENNRLKIAIIPETHKTTHQVNGEDEINVTNLSGVLKDKQHPIVQDVLDIIGLKSNSNPMNHDRFSQDEIANLPESQLSLNNPTHSNSNDPTTNEKAALSSSISPSSLNPFITESRSSEKHHSKSEVLTLLGEKENSLGTGTASQYLRGDKTWQTLNKSSVGLDQVDNTSDLDKPISTATQAALNAKADLVGGVIPSAQLPSYVDDVIERPTFADFPAVGESSKIYLELQYNIQYRWSGTAYAKITTGEVTSVNNKKGVVTLDKSDVGLSQVDNTSDLDKPISTATQVALNGKQPTITTGLNSQYYRGDKTWQTLDKNSVGLGSVDNTADLDKPVSTATQSALDQKSNYDHIHDLVTQAINGFMSASDKTKLDMMKPPLKTSAQVTNSSNTTLVNISELSVPVYVGKSYALEFYIMYRTPATTTGIGLSLSYPTGNLAASCRTTYSNTDGNAAEYIGTISSTGDVVTSTSTPVANTPMLAKISAIFTPTVDGYVTPMFRSEVNNSQVIVLAGSMVKTEVA